MNHSTDHRHRGGGLPLGRIFTAVVALHIVAGGTVYWIAKTSAGQEFAKTYHIKLFQEKPPEPEKKAEEKPPPPPPPKVEPLKPPPESAAPRLASLAPAAAPSIGGGGGSPWTSGKFAGGFEGPDGALRAALTGHLRECMKELGVEEASFPAVALDFGVRPSGEVNGIRLVRRSGNAEADALAERVAQCAATKGGVAPPDGKGRIVTVQFRPSY